MHPIIRPESNLDIERQPNNHKTSNHDDKDGRAVAGIKLREVQIALLAFVCNCEKTLIKPALAASRAAAFETYGNRRLLLKTAIVHHTFFLCHAITLGRDTKIEEGGQPPTRCHPPKTYSVPQISLPDLRPRRRLRQTGTTRPRQQSASTRPLLRIRSDASL